MIHSSRQPGLSIIGIVLIQAVSYAADGPVCGLSFRAVDPFGLKFGTLRVESLRTAGSKGPELSSRFKNGFAFLPCGTYAGTFGVDGLVDKDRIDDIRAIQQRDI